MTVRLFSFPRWAAGLVILAISVPLSACQSKMGPSASHLTQETISLEYFQQQLSHRQTGLTDLKSFVRTTVETKDRKHSFRQTLLIHQEDSLRIDTMNVFGQPLGVFIFNQQLPQGSKVLLYDPGRNRLILGEEVQKVLSRTLGMSLNFEKYLPVFYGAIPQMQSLKIIQGALSEDGKTYQLKAVDPVERVKIDIELDAFTLLPSRILRKSKSLGMLEVQWEDYRKIDRWDVPHHITLQFPDRGEKLTLKYTDPVVNTGIPADAFMLALPKASVSLPQY